MNDDYDSPWKEALEVYFHEFIEFFFPHAAREIDWTRGHEFLDNELRQVVREAESGRHVVDKLARVFLLDAAEVWVLIHIEVQGQWEDDFHKRMYTCHHRLFDRFDQRIASFAVLSDELPNWRPDRFESELWGCRVEFTFLTVKLLDFAPRWAELEASNNPFAVVVMAHLKTQETRGDNANRYGWKLRLTRGLYERGYSGEQVRKLFRFIDWVMWLPDDLRQTYWTEVRHIEEEKRMPFVDIATEMGLRQGLQQGRVEGRLESLLEILQLRFQAPAAELQPRLVGLTAEQLRGLTAPALSAVSLEEFIKLLPTTQN